MNKWKDHNAAHLRRAANIIRTEMLQMSQDYKCSLSENCQFSSVPQSLLSIIYMLTVSTRHENDQAREALSQRSPFLS